MRRNEHSPIRPNDGVEMGDGPYKVYAETCATLRHYSNASFLVRSASVVQGGALLVPWIAAVTQGTSDILLLYAIPVAGLIFTVLLYRFHMSYFRAAEFFYKAASRIERKYFDEECRPVSAYDAQHEAWYAGRVTMFFTLHAPFTLTGLLFASALAITVIRHHVAPGSSSAKQEAVLAASSNRAYSIVVASSDSRGATTSSNDHAVALGDTPTSAGSSNLDQRVHDLSHTNGP